MIMLTGWHGNDLKDAEHYVLIVDAKGAYREYKVRCLGNSPGCTIIGHLEYNEDFMTYTLFATENLPLESFTFLRRLDLDYYKDLNYCNDRKEVDSEFISRKALARAKDIKFKF